MRLYPHCRRSSKSLEFYEFFGCYVTKWDHNLNNCWFVRLCLGFHGVSSRKTFRAPAWHKSVRTQNNHHLYKHLEDERRIAKLAHMTDMFEHLNEFNIKMQGKNENHTVTFWQVKRFQTEKNTLENWTNTLNGDHWKRFQEAIKMELLTKLTCCGCSKNTLLYYIRNTTVTFLQKIRNNIVGSEILFQLIVKCQRKNYPCLLEKHSRFPK